MKVLVFIVVIYIITETKAQTTIDGCVPHTFYYECRQGSLPPNICCEIVPPYHHLQMPNLDDCTSYYQCSKHQSILVSCPQGLHWSIQSERCEWPDANCTVSQPPPEENGGYNEDNVEGSGIANEDQNGSEPVRRPNIIRDASDENDSSEDDYDDGEIDDDDNDNNSSQTNNNNDDNDNNSSQTNSNNDSASSSSEDK